ncbi:hypothetical protein EYF80_001163 [Liparis tanakae]|uniref:Uncharacterized protein n=1 Tax=Liparis tanakae TaxID=230148 RepID=A0A4Z2JEF0_9TELE|nr:hypothetical protein EYF80_001163 [Liparis tanakae]
MKRHGGPLQHCARSPPCGPARPPRSASPETDSLHAALGERRGGGDESKDAGGEREKSALVRFPNQGEVGAGKEECRGQLFSSVQFHKRSSTDEPFLQRLLFGDVIVGGDTGSLRFFYASPNALRLAFAHKESPRWENVQIPSDVCDELCHSGCISDDIKRSARGDRRHLSVTSSVGWEIHGPVSGLSNRHANRSESCQEERETSSLKALTLLDEHGHNLTMVIRLADPS